MPGVKNKSSIELNKENVEHDEPSLNSSNTTDSKYKQTPNSKRIKVSPSLSQGEESKFG